MIGNLIIHNNMNLQLNRVIKDFEGIEITIFMRQHRLSCYVTQTFDGDQRLELIVYKIIGVTTDFVEFWHEVHDCMNGSGNVCKITKLTLDVIQLAYFDGKVF